MNEPSSIIKSFGGPEELAAKLRAISGREDISAEGVQKWRERKRIATRWLPYLQELGNREGVPIDPLALLERGRDEAA